MCVDDRDDMPTDTPEPNIEPASDKPVDHLIFVIHVSWYSIIHQTACLLTFLHMIIIIGYRTGKKKKVTRI